MKNNKFIILLKSISTFQLNRFGKYLNSPYFNSDKNLNTFYNKFRKTINLENKIPPKEKIWLKTQGRTVFNNQKLNRYFSDLCIHLEDFLTYEKLKSDKLLFDSTKIEVLNNPKLRKNFSGALRSFNSNIKNTDSAIDKNYFLYKTHRSEHDFLYKSGGKFTNFTYLNKADFHIDRMYIILKLQHYIEELDYTMKYNEGPKISISKPFLKLIAQEKYQKEPTIKSFYLIQKLLTEPDENNERFFEIFNLIKNTSDNTILYTDLKNIYLALINYCINVHINKGNPDFYPLLFSIYKEGLKKKIFHAQDVLHFQSYKNIITVGLYLKQFTWVENFINEYTDQLQHDLKKNALNYNLATLAYKKKDYDTVISQMNLVTYDNLYYALGARIFLLRTYYETHSEIPFESLVFSFSAYILRNKELSQNMKKQYLNFIKMLKKIYYMNPYDKDKTNKIESEINNAKALIHKKYLLEQWSIKIKSK